MAVYAIGDVQGCIVALEELLNKIHFNPKQDTLWLTGDLVNRGAHSLETLRFVKDLGNSAVTVLGNHDLHLLAVAEGIREEKNGDTLSPILNAHDADELLHWLRHRPLIHADKQLKTLMVHAGIYPSWSRKQALACASEVEHELRGNKYKKLLEKMYQAGPLVWQDSLTKWDRYRFTINACTRMRFLTPELQLNFDQKQSPNQQFGGYIPWFDIRERQCVKWNIVFGHWSALGFMLKNNIIALDSGCVWGGKLTAIALDDAKYNYTQIQCHC